MAFDWSQKRVLVTGGHGFLGRVLCRKLVERGCLPITSNEVELTAFSDTYDEFKEVRPDIVFHLAAVVGGIGANKERPGRFFYDNMQMGLNVIEAARVVGVEKFVMVGTACSYPADARLPIHESDLWKGYPEPTNAPYGIAKRALSTMLHAYRQQYGFNGIYVILANLYGPEDNFDPETSHVIPALIRRFVEAANCPPSSVTCWGSGVPTREFLYVDDAADALIRCAERIEDSYPINIGSGDEISIQALAEKISRMAGYDGRITWGDKPDCDGQLRRRLDTSRAREVLNWERQVSLDDGLSRTIEWWQEQHV